MVTGRPWTDADWEDLFGERTASYDGQAVYRGHFAHPDTHPTSPREIPSSHHDNTASYVGWTVVNRMKRDGTTSVSHVWDAYSHRRKPDAHALQIADDILSGRITDPTHGATHFYSPGRMPGPHDNTLGRDVGGGLEVVDGRPSYRPSFASPSSGFKFVPSPNIDQKDFEFFRQAGTGMVR